MVDSGASMHVVSEKDQTMRTSKSPTTVMMATGEVRTSKEATVYVKQLDLFVTVMLTQKTPTMLSLGETLRRTWVHVSLEKLSKTHIKLIAIYQTLYHVWFLE